MNFEKPRLNRQQAEVPLTRVVPPPQNASLLYNLTSSVFRSRECKDVSDLIIYYY